ncbi:hypothetical protein HYFRA_00002893 [Hymenoscyphus fraxineus]|uniref:Uncharacterized protein n=1 Tax=Hymenoscyphus fraxineus TaxID=746836 RepID=A0A9N9KQ28_9HELO|nr:hypothetical protein HYFRA_00002893 [Hymenoscyphus fraxineus]
MDYKFTHPYTDEKSEMSRQSNEASPREFTELSSDAVKGDEASEVESVDEESTFFEAEFSEGEVVEGYTTEGFLTEDERADEDTREDFSSKDESADKNAPEESLTVNNTPSTSEPNTPDVSIKKGTTQENATDRSSESQQADIAGDTQLAKQASKAKTPKKPKKPKLKQVEEYMLASYERKVVMMNKAYEFTHIQGSRLPYDEASADVYVDSVIAADFPDTTYTPGNPLIDTARLLTVGAESHIAARINSFRANRLNHESGIYWQKVAWDIAELIYESLLRHHRIPLGPHTFNTYVAMLQDRLYARSRKRPKPPLEVMAGQSAFTPLRTRFEGLVAGTVGLGECERVLTLREREALSLVGEDGG